MSTLANAPDASRSGAARASLLARWRSLLPVGVVLLLIVVFGLTSDAFLTPRNFTAIAGQASTLLIACLGASFIVVMGSIDLSIGAVVLLTGAASVLTLNAVPIGAGAVLVGFGLGGILGLVNGLVFAFGRIPSFVVTLGTMSIFSGLALRLLDGRAIAYDSAAFETLAIGQWIPRLPNIALIALVLWAVLVVVAMQTRFGRYVFTIGAGESVARIAGVPVRRYKIYAFILSGALAGIAGSLAAARLSAAGPTLGSDLLLNSLGAIVIGGTSLAGGIGGVQRTLIGVLIIALLDNGLNLNGIDQYTQMGIKGVVIIAAVLVSQPLASIRSVK
ncbi:ABC transporter permease [Kaistia terrae]|uniref:ABC transporter permease n=1 Tax=Kaistia terrae TaxID=537017 RepID=A0ABW0Q1J6_9HYPH|nr:ABC transporter permease [Kaistia terrae]MCX5579710.1 ABC transporter permease [Kaistia terrae]